ncbi:MAG: glycosyltransferase family 87 protein [Candidatus Sulfotelmatobacter sp.]
MQMCPSPEFDRVASVTTPVNPTKKYQALIWLVVSLCVSAIALLYARQILAPWAEARDAQKGGLQAQMGDIYPRWVGARELLLYRHNPYGPEVSHEIQMAYYGHIVTDEESRTRVVDEQRFAYPVYVVFLLAPTIHMDFATVQKWAPFVLGAFAGLSVLFCVGLLEWSMPWTMVAALVLFTLSSSQIEQGIRHQQFALVVGFLLVAGAWCVHKGHLLSGGVLLALATIKPQMVLLPLVWFLIWTLGEWRSRWRLPASFGGTLALLVIAGEILLPGWLRDFIAGMAAYRKYFPTTSVLRLLLGDWLGIAVSSVIIVWLLIYGGTRRKVGGDSRNFTLTFAAFLIVTVITFPLFTPFNQVLLILPALLVLQEWASVPRLSRLAFVAVICWPWITSTALLLWKIPVNPANRIPLIPAVAASLLPLLLPVILFTRKSDVLSQVEGA